VGSKKKALVIAAVSLMLAAACRSSKKATTAPTTASPATTAAGSSTTAASGPATTAGGSSGSGPPNTPLPPVTGHTTTGVTATEIHVGAILYKAFYADGVTGFMARVKKENDAGGVYGRKIVLDAQLDDGQVESQDITAAKTLVQQDNVFAVVPVFTAAFSGAPYLNSSKVPFFGWSVQPVWCNLDWGFGFWGNDCDPTAVPLTGDFPQVEKQLFPDQSLTGKAIAIVGEENDSARVQANSLKSIWTTDGAKVVEVDSSIPSPPAVVGDYTPFADKIMTSNGGQPPDLVTIVGSVSDTLQLYKKLNQLGFKGIVQDYDLYDPHFAASTKGLVTNVQVEPFEAASSVPAVQTMIADLKAYDPNFSTSQTSAAGYWTADFFIQALKKVGPDLSREALYNAINGGFTYDYNGGGGIPVQWPVGHSYIQVGTGYVQANGTGFTVLVKPDHALPYIPNPAYKKP
jgi:ABC-type branched-subunit amino acid transport system substrate-binding protein